MNDVVNMSNAHGTVSSDPILPNQVVGAREYVEKVVIQIPDHVALKYEGDLLGIMKELKISDFMIDFVMDLNGYTNVAEYSREDVELKSYDEEELIKFLNSGFR